MSRLSSAFAFVVTTLALLSGCAHVNQRSAAAARFRQLHDCEPSWIEGENDRWVVEGCGIEAHFTCMDRYDRDHDPTRFGDQICVQEESRPISTPVAPPPADLRPHQEHGKLSVAVQLDYGWFIAKGTPKTDPENVLLSYREPADGAAACDLQLFADGQPLVSAPVTNVAFNGWTERRVRVSADEFRHLVNAVRVDVALCKRRLTLGEKAHARLESFAVHFFALR